MVLGGETAGSTAITAEARRAMLAETPTAAGERVRRSFSVDVREPEGEPTGPSGSPGLDLYFGGAAPRLESLKVTPSRPSQLLLAGDSTVCDHMNVPYTGWGQRIPQFFQRGLEVANYADSGEGSESFLDDPALYPALRPRIHRGDPVLIQFGHNDKQTTAENYRANLTRLIEGVREARAKPVLVTPVVRRWFNADGTLDNDAALHVSGPGVDLPAQMRALAADESVPLIDLTALTKSLVESLGPEGSKVLHLYNEKRDKTHTSEHGASEFAKLVLGGLDEQGIVPGDRIR